MTKCANCSLDAVYTCADPGVNPVNYCSNCIPQWLRGRAAAGHFTLVSETPKTSKKKPAAEEAPADESN